MVAIHRRSLICPIGIPVLLATTDDLDGTVDGTQVYDITGAQRVLFFQADASGGADGTAGIDVIEVSHDGGFQWYADGVGATPATGLLCSADDDAGTLLVDGVLNVAGVEPTVIGATAAAATAGLFKFGPFEGPTLIRCARGGVGAGGTAWQTTAPSVSMIPIGIPSGGGAIAAEV